MWHTHFFLRLKILHIVILAVITATLAIFGFQFGSSYMYHVMIADVSMEGYDICDADCASRFDERYDFKCTEISSDEFVCRGSRQAVTFGDDVGWVGTYPHHYGEILALPDAQYKRASFDISGMEILDIETETVRIYFAPYHDPTNIMHTATIRPGDMFIAGCTDDNEPVHLFRHIGIYERDGVDYLELWAAHPVPPEGLIPCDLSDAVKTSLQVSYDVVLPEYDNFGFDQ